MAAGPGQGAGVARRRLGAAERMPQILDAALAEFAERGYGGASMAGAAARAGIAKGLIYHYFPGKSELFKAVVRSFVQPAFAEAERLLAGFPGSRAELLRQMIGRGHGHLAAARREILLFRLLLAEAHRFPELAAFYRDEVLAREIALVRAVLRAGVASGEFRPEAAEDPGMAAVLMAPIGMAAVWRMMLGEDLPAEAVGAELAAMREAHLALALRGLLRQPG